MANGPVAQAERSTSEQLADLKRHFKTLWRAKLWILAIWMGVATAAIGVAYMMPNVYRSSTMILVERQKVPEAYVKATVSDDMQELLKTISQQILSRTQVQQVIKEYDLANAPTTLELMLKRVHLINLPGMQTLSDKLEAWFSPSTPRSNEALVRQFQSRVKVKVVGRQAFSVAYDGHDPLTVMRVTNAMAGMFIAENLRLRESRAEGTTRFLGLQLKQARRELEVMESKVQDFKSRNMGALPGQLDANLRSLDRLQLELQHVDESYAGLVEQRNFLKRQALASGAQLAVLSDSAREALQRQNPLAHQLAMLEARLTSLRTQYTDLYPGVVQTQAQIQEISQQMQARIVGGTESAEDGEAVVPMAADLRRQVSEINHKTAALEARRGRMAIDFESYKQRVELTPQVEQELQKLQRDYSIMQTNYQGLLQKQMDAKLAESLERRQKGEQFRVIDPANLPVVPISPRRNVIILLGLLAGLAMAIGGVLVRDMMRPRFYTSEDVSSVLDMPVLAVVPHVRELEHGA